MTKRIKHNDLLPWFTQDHGTLPAAYLASCETFFNSLKQQAPSRKQQAASLTKQDSGTIKDVERNKLCKQKKH
jgi:hypothetical protein